MPRFYEEVEVDVDISDYLEACSSQELRKIYQELIDNYKSDVIDVIKASMSVSERVFNSNLSFLQENYLSLSNEDIKTIILIAKKYGMA